MDIVRFSCSPLSCSRGAVFLENSGQCNTLLHLLMMIITAPPGTLVTPSSFLCSPPLVACMIAASSTHQARTAPWLLEEFLSESASWLSGHFHSLGVAYSPYPANPGGSKPDFLTAGQEDSEVQFPLLGSP